MNTAAVLNRLINLETRVHQQGWQAGPRLTMIHPAGDTCFWTDSAWAPPSVAHRTVVNLAAGLTQAPPPRGSVELVRMLRDHAADSVAAAVVAIDRPAGVPTVRQITAVDLAGNRYRVTRERGHLIQHLIEPPAGAGDSPLHTALRQMIAATARAASGTTHPAMPMNN